MGMYVCCMSITPAEESPLLFSINKSTEWSITDTTPPGPKHLLQLPASLKKPTMMLLQCFVPLCVLFILGWLGQRSEGRTVILDKCVVNIHMHELQKHYSSVRSSAISGDSLIEMKLLDKALIKKVKEGQTCCFIRLLLRFFVERVFVSFSPSEADVQRAVSALANGFISVHSSMHKCIQVSEATMKAVGELDTVLEWIKGLSQKAQTRK